MQKMWPCLQRLDHVYGHQSHFCKIHIKWVKIRFAIHSDLTFSIWIFAPFLCPDWLERTFTETFSLCHEEVLTIKNWIIQKLRENAKFSIIFYTSAWYWQHCTLQLSILFTVVFSIRRLVDRRQILILATHLPLSNEV